jgi:hypothetical protein
MTKSLRTIKRLGIHKRTALLAPRGSTDFATTCKTLPLLAFAELDRLSPKAVNRLQHTDKTRFESVSLSASV